MKALRLLEILKNVKERNQLEIIIDFYSKKFNPELVLQYFENWALEHTDKYKNGIILTNTHSNHKWQTEMIINDNAEYSFANDDNWQYIPETFADFISDILRDENFDLIFSEKSISELSVNLISC